MSREVRGMLMGLCIVILAAAAYFPEGEAHEHARWGRNDDAAHRTLIDTHGWKSI